MKVRIALLIGLILIFSSCASSPTIITPMFKAIQDETVIVMMQNGEDTAYVNNVDFDIRIQQMRNEKGMVVFIFSLRNNMENSIIKLRYDDFILEYSNTNNIKALNLDAYIEKQIGSDRRYLSDSGYREIYNEYRKVYLLENDIRANGGETLGVIAFNYENFNEFKVNIRITKENFLLRNMQNEGQITTQYVTINYRSK